MIVDKHQSDKNDLINFLERLIDVQSLVDVCCYFVGGCVRDRLIGEDSYDYDLAVEGDLTRIIYALGETYILTPSILGTAKVRFGKYHVDLATFRSERYVTNNGLPEIDAGTIETDLFRRDFTINTGYVLLSHENLDKMLHVDDIRVIEMAFAHPNFYEDIENNVLRVLHDRSFLEDPSRMLRVVKYSTLYHFKMDEATQSLFNMAIKEHVLELYSKDRYRQIIFGYAKHDQGILILTNLFEESLLLGIEASESTSVTRVKTYYDLFVSNNVHLLNRGTLYLLLMYEHHLEFWIGADRRISEVAKSCRDLKEIVAATQVTQWQSRWWCYETFKRFDDNVFNFVRYAVSCPDSVKLALRIYCDETQFITLGINGNTLKNLGMESGKKIGVLLNLLLAHKVDTGLNMTQEEEIKWIESKRDEY